MFATLPTPDVRGILYEQQYYFATELGRNHQSLSKLYKKLAKVERSLAERKERNLSRHDKKKLQWTRALSMKAVSNLESQQMGLHERLRQCNFSIWSLEHALLCYFPLYHQQYWDSSMLLYSGPSSSHSSPTDSVYCDYWAQRQPPYTPEMWLTTPSDYSPQESWSIWGRYSDSEHSTTTVAAGRDPFEQNNLSPPYEITPTNRQTERRSNHRRCYSDSAIFSVSEGDHMLQDRMRGVSTNREAHLD